MTYHRIVHQVPLATLLIILIPCVAGIGGTLLSAFSYLPGLGLHQVTINAFVELFEHPQFLPAFRLTLVSGFAATLLAYGLTIVVFAWIYNRRFFIYLQRLLSQLLAIPHATFALAILYLLSTNGWLTRIPANLFGYETPPQHALFPDYFGTSYTIVLALREMPFLILMALAALHDIPVRQRIIQLTTLGYSPVKAWLIGIQPAIHAKMRMPIYAVLIFSLSVVDMALLLAPQRPPPLQVLMLQWYYQPDIARYLPITAAASVLLLVCTPVAILCFNGISHLCAKVAKIFLVNGQRGSQLERLPVPHVIVTLFILIYLALALFALSSIASNWRFPQLLPSSISFDYWLANSNLLLIPLMCSLGLGLISASIATVLIVFSLEAINTKHGHRQYRIILLSLITLFLPQIAFLFGIQILFVKLGSVHPFLALVWTHIIFVLPYVLLSLCRTWLAFDRKYLLTAACLGLSPWQQFVKVRLPLMARPIAIAWAVGFSVSLALYLPNQLIGHFPTLITEAITLSSGGNSQIVGMTGLLQMLLPFIAFSLAYKLFRPSQHRSDTQLYNLSKQYVFRTQA